MKEAQQMNALFDLEKIFNHAINDEIVNAEKMDKEMFRNYLEGLLIKLKNSSSVESDSQIEIIERMKRSLGRQQYILVNHSIQAKMIREMIIQIQVLETNNENLIEENDNLKKLINL